MGVIKEQVLPDRVVPKTGPRRKGGHAREVHPSQMRVAGLVTRGLPGGL